MRALSSVCYNLYGGVILKKINKINNILIFLTSLASICYAIKDFNYGAYDRLISSISIIFILIIPKIVNKIYKNKINNILECIYILFIILAQFLGSVVNLYSKIWWYDLFTHFLSGVLTSILALIILKYLKMDNDKRFNILFIICFTQMIASIWEFLEFGAFIIFKMDVQRHLTTGVFDTMEDMLSAFLGSIIISIYYLFKKYIRKNSKL